MAQSSGEKNIAFSRWGSLFSGFLFFSEGKELPGKSRQSEWGGKKEEMEHQGEFKLQELNYEIAEGIV